MGQHVVGIDVDYPVDVLEGLLVVAYLGVDEAAVVERERVARLVAQHGVEVGHRPVVVVPFVEQQGAVEVCEGVGGVELNRAVEVFDGLVIQLLSGIYARPPDVAFRLEAVELYRLVVVGEGLGRIGEEEVRCPSVEVGGRISGLLLYIEVEVGHGVLEVLGQEGGDSPGEVYSDFPRPELQGPFEVPESRLVVARAAFGDGAVVVAVGEHRV